MSFALYEQSVFSDGVAVTLSDSTLYSRNAGLLVGGAGTVVIETRSGSTITITAVAGQRIPIDVNKVKTGGTATGLILLR